MRRRGEGFAGFREKRREVSRDYLEVVTKECRFLGKKKPTESERRGRSMSRGWAFLDGQRSVLLLKEQGCLRRKRV